MNRAYVTVLTVLWIAGCASAPDLRYYTLDMRPSGAAQAAKNIRIDRLREAEPLARKDILIQRSPTQVEYYAVDQWAATLGELVGQKLEAEFGPPEEGRPTVVVTGMILEFGQVDVSGGAEASVRLKLEFRGEDMGRYDEALLTKTYAARLPTGTPAPGAVVEGLSRCLEKLAAEIVSDAEGL